MSMFSRPDKRRMNIQADSTMHRYAGNTATWRAFVSATSGVPEAGIGSAVFYREQTITAHFGVMLAAPRLGESVSPVGQIAAGMFQMTTREKIGREDEIVWQGATYRIEAAPVPATMLGWWITTLKRGSE
jgi:hypothetical protein